MLSVDHSRGFTIIELLVGITLLAVLLALGAPAMGTYLQNSKLASATSAFYSAIQTARTEAIRRNVRTEFVFTNDPISTPDLANALTPANAGVNWVVRAASAAGVWQPAIDARAGTEGEGSATAAALVVAGSASGVAWGGIIPFNGFGGTADGAPYSIDISNPAAGACAAVSGPIRCRRINVSPGGQITACDPAAAAGDSRAC